MRRTWQQRSLCWKGISMLCVVTPSEMRKLEQKAFLSGVSSLLLMENAAHALLEELVGLLGGAEGKVVLFFCGSGNNGGDGLAAARLFCLLGGKAFVCLSGEVKTPDALTNLRYAQALGLPIVQDPADLPVPDAVVDALFGTGLDRPPEGRAAALIDTINHYQVPVLCADVPSGFEAQTGQAYDHCVKATKTVTFQFPKTGLYLTQSPDHIGELVVRDIGIPSDIHPDLSLTTLEPWELHSRLPQRSRAAHKGSNGRVLIYAGSVGMAGAAAMAALACLRAGAGLVTIACQEEMFPVLQALVPGAQCLPIRKVLKQVPAHDVLLAGCGLGQETAVWDNLMCLYDPALPTVMDADALNLLAKSPRILGEKTIITPHIGEAGRLLSWPLQAVMASMPDAARILHGKYGCIVALKSHCSVITDGTRTALNTVGSPALAKGGSGDALAGLMAGLLAQGMPPFEAARTACLWLGKAGCIAEEKFGVQGALTTDIISLLGEAAKV